MKRRKRPKEQSGASKERRSGMFKVISRLIPIIILLLTIVVGIWGFSTYTFDNRSDAADTSLFKDKYLSVGPEEIVTTVDKNVKNSPILGIDAPFVSVKTTEGVRAYLSASKSIKNGANWTGGPGETYTFLAPSLDQLFDSSKAKEYYKPSLAPSQTTTPQDDAGSWMISVMPLSGTTMLGWFHGEQSGGFRGLTTMRQFAAISKDSGRTWRDLGVILSNDPNNSKETDVIPANQITRDDINMNTIIKSGNTLYAGFSALDYQAGFAKADYAKVVAAMQANKSGAEFWQKLKCSGGATCTFSIPGIGATPSKISKANYGGGFSYSTPLKRFVSFHATARWGLLFSSTDDITKSSWTEHYPIVAPVAGKDDPRADNWDYSTGLATIDQRDYNRLARLAYTSVVATDGSMGSLGNDFYVYYVKTPEFQTFFHHVLVRRKVSLKEKNKDVPVMATDPLIEFKSNDGKKSRTSVDTPVRTDYKKSGTTLGLVSSHEAAGLIPIYECYFPEWDNYMIVAAGGVKTTGKEYQCNGQNVKYVRRLGYVSEKKSNFAPTPLIECFNNETLNHFYVTKDADCDKAKNSKLTKSWTYGYLFTDSTMKTPVPKPDPPTPPTIPQPDLTLQRVTKTSDGKTKTRLITSLSKADSSLGSASTFGTIYKTAGTGRKVLHECYIKIWDDYMLATFDGTSQPDNFCRTASQEEYRGVVGYISAASNSITAKPFKECFDEANLDHFYVTKDSGCKEYATAKGLVGKVRDSWVWGYIK